LAQVLNAGLDGLPERYLTTEMLPVDIITVVGDELERWIDVGKFSLSRVADRSLIWVDFSSSGLLCLDGDERDYSSHVLQNPYLQAFVCLSMLGTAPAPDDPPYIRVVQREASSLADTFMWWVIRQHGVLPEEDRARFSELRDKVSKLIHLTEQVDDKALIISREKRAAGILRCMEEAPFFFGVGILLSCLVPDLVLFCGSCSRFYPIEYMMNGWCSACCESFRHEVLSEDDGFNGHYSGTDWED